MSDREHASAAHPEAPAWVTVELRRRDVTLPWTTRDALLATLRASSSGDDAQAGEIRAAMEDIPATSPVLLTLEHKLYLLRVLGEWSDTAGGYDAMPPGLFELHKALMEELREAERRQATA